MAAPHRPAEADRHHLAPRDTAQLAEVIAWANANHQPLAVEGSGSRRDLGRPPAASYTLSLAAFSGIRLYEPQELVLGAGAGTPMVDIEAALAEAGQQFAFEPFDPAALLGVAPGAGSLGGLAACNLAGPRRLVAGAARDHMLGVKAVSGRGEVFKAGGRVVKNVTGFDMTKLLAGSWGTLAAMHEVTFKVLPRPEDTRTVLVEGLDDAAAVRAMAAAMNSTHEVSGAAHLPPAAARSCPVEGGGRALTALRLEGTPSSVRHRADALASTLGEMGETDIIEAGESRSLWQAIRDAAPLARPRDTIVWRLSVPPTAGAVVAAELGSAVTAHFLDWAGGLVWLAVDPETAADGLAGPVVAAVTRHGGHAMAVRAPRALRGLLPVFAPQPDGVRAIARRIKDGFDPLNVLNPGRLYAEF